MSGNRPELTRANAILPLRWAAGQFLQVLLGEFKLRRLGRGVQLSLRLNDDDETIWLREAKRLVVEGIDDFARRALQYQSLLDDFLIAGNGNRLEFPQPGAPPFPFRYASGGTLPIARISGSEPPSQDYYVLFYREIGPVGWNIANGGCDTRNELLLPGDAVSRELREELLLIDTRNRRRYVFGDDLDKPIDRPEFAAARMVWREILKVDPDRFEVIQIPVKWFDGPDEVVVTAGRQVYHTRGYFLNINALDHGIEIDRVAKIHIDQDVSLCFGEQLGDGQLVNAPIGLFEVEKFDRLLQQGEQRFAPDRFFWSGVLYDGEDLDKVIDDQWLPSLAASLSPGDLDEYQAKRRTGDQYDLCPVTRRIAQRFVCQHPVAARTGGPSDVFLSFASEDGEVAESVFRHLRQTAEGGVFFSPRTLANSNFSRAIDDALEQATRLVVVGTKLEHLTKGWVEWEWRTFHNLINSGRKPRDAQFPTSDRLSLRSRCPFR
ncbi:MAG: TIR domain-containing protein [Gemmatimonadales bacterium]